MPPKRVVFPPIPMGALPRYPARRSRKRTNRFGWPECRKAILKYKWFILVAVLIAGISPFIGTQMRGRIYRAEAVIAPKSGVEKTTSGFLSLLGNRGLRRRWQNMNRTDEEAAYLKISMIARSLRFGQYIYDKYGQELIPLVFFRDWDSENNRWRWGRRVPTKQMIVRQLGWFALIMKDKRSEFIHVHSVHPEPETAKYLVDLYLKALSEFLRNETITEARNLQHFLAETAHNTSDVLLREKLYEMLEQAQSKELFAYAHTPYGFKIIDPAVVPDKDKYIRPKYFRRCATNIVSMLLLAAGLAISVEFIRYARPYITDKG